MALFGKKMGPLQEIGVSAGVMALGVGLWFFTLYQPVARRTDEVKQLVNSQEDSLKAVTRYKTNVASLQIKINDVKAKVTEWDSRFPPRTQIVSLATQILNFGARHNLLLVEMRPSLYELYALEKAGAHISGRYVMQMPLNCHFKGKYLDLGTMLEDVSSLPFNVTIADVSLEPLKDDQTSLDIRLRLFLYVHL